MRALILLAILGSALAVPTNPGRIIGGEDTDIETNPFVANLQYAVWGIIWTQGCGGSLISSDHVLTAAHCVEFDPTTAWRVNLGSALRSGEGGRIHLLSKITIHPDYAVESTMDADVALLTLETRVVMSSTIQTIRIASSNTQLYTGLGVIVAGWGTTSYEGETSPVLQQADMFILDQDSCRERHAYLQTQPGFSSWPSVTDNMVCAGTQDGSKDTCQGDSGGPVFVRAGFNILVGISSWGYQCSSSDYPSVYVNLPKFTEWIVENTS